MTNDGFVGALYTYPWDLADDGVDAALDRIVDLTGCSEIQLTPSYHVSNYFLPHNPKSPIRFGENGAVFFRPELSRYDATEIKPHVSGCVTTPDYFERLVDAINRKGLVFSAWNVYFFNHYLSEKHPQFAKHDVFGTPYIGQLSPSSKGRAGVRRRAHARGHGPLPTPRRPHRGAPAADVASRDAQEQVSGRHLGAVPVPSRRLLQSRIHAKRRGSGHGRGDLPLGSGRLAARRTRKDTDGAGPPTTRDAEWIANAFDGRLRKYLDILNAHTTGLWLRVAEVIKKGGGKVQSDYLAHGIRTDTNGLEPRINKHIDRLTAGLPATEDDAKAQMREYLDMIAPGGEVFVPVGPGNITEAAPLVERTRAVAEAGAAGALFYNYGLMREEVLGFVGEALRSVPRGDAGAE